MTWKLPVDKVLVPFDFSRACCEAVRVGQSLAREPGEVLALYVVAEPPITDAGVVWGDLDVHAAGTRAEADLGRKLAAEGLEVRSRVSRGDPAHRIVSFAAEEGFDLIVMPSHGRRGLQRLLLGSVTERVVRLATVPVLVLRAREHEG